MAITLVQMSSQTQKMEGAAVVQLTQFSMITEDASQLQKEYVEDGGFPIYTSQTKRNTQSQGEPQPKRWVVNLPEDASEEEEDKIVELFVTASSARAPRFASSSCTARLKSCGRS